MLSCSSTDPALNESRVWTISAQSQPLVTMFRRKSSTLSDKVGDRSADKRMSLKDAHEMDSYDDVEETVSDHISLA